MSQHTMNRIAAVLQRQFDGKIDMSDWSARPADQTHLAFLSRALAALAVRSLAGADVDTSAASVTDGFGDGGIDALYFDQSTDTFYLVQSKWSADGATPITAEKIGAFISGIRDLLNMQLTRFNQKIQNKKPEITEALYAERPITYVFVTIQTAVDELAPFVKRKLDDFVSELNDPVPVADPQYFSQAGVYDLITSESEPLKINLQIAVRDWGAIDKPYLAYYGRVHIGEVAQWWREHKNSLFAHNLRLFYRSSDVNDALKGTLDRDFENFWYFNNGITVICDEVTKAGVGAPGRQIGIFNCSNASIVNGAQTVGTIGTVWAETKEPDVELDDNAPQAWVQVRIISLQKSPPAFTQTLTRAANLQNRVGNREFAAMDPVQHRIATEFALDQRRYAYKQGEVDPRGEDGCGIDEATQALACAHSVELSVQVKREISALWANTSTPPYKDLFNDSITSEMVWRSVLVMRAVEKELHTLRKLETPKADLVGIHLNRLISHLVFQSQKVRALNHGSADLDLLKKAASEESGRLFTLVCEYIQHHHEKEYLASFAKNSKKCTALAVKLEAPSTVGSQTELF